MKVCRNSNFLRGGSKLFIGKAKNARCSRRTRTLQTVALKSDVGPSIAIVDSSGEMGEKCLKAIKDINLPYREMRLLASDSSVGQLQEWDGEEYTIEELDESSFEGVDLALFIAEDNDNILHYGPMAILGGTSVAKCELDDKNRLCCQEGFFEEVEGEELEEIQKELERREQQESEEAEQQEAKSEGEVKEEAAS